jgi:hypothetical protein
MSLYKSIPSFTNTSVPSDRFTGPFIPWGRCDQTNGLYNYYAGWATYFLNSPKTISTAKFEVVTAMTNTGTAPVIQLAFYYPANVSGQVRVGVQIPNSLATGIIATTTGVKTISYSPSWQAPRGIFFALIKSTGSADNNTGTIRSFNTNSGAAESILTQFMGGFSSSTPTSIYGTPAFPVPSSFGLTQDLLTDYTSTGVTYNTYTGSNIPSANSGIFIG